MTCFKHLASALAIALALSGPSPSSAQQASDDPRSPVPMKLYTLDCGLTEFKDSDVFADTGEYEGRTIRRASSRARRAAASPTSG